MLKLPTYKCLSLIALVSGLSACGFTQYKNATATAATAPAPITEIVLNLAVQPAALSILSTHCLSCHGTENMGGLSSITDPNHLIQQGLIIPGNPSASILIQYTSKGLMPPTNPLASSDIATLQSWVQGTVVTPTPAPSPSQGAGGGALAQQVTTIFSNKCLSCHGSGGSGGLSNITNLAALVQGGFAVPGNPASSPVYTQVSGGMMPPSGGLAQGDIQTIASWINAGAPAN